MSRVPFGSHGHDPGGIVYAVASYGVGAAQTDDLETLANNESGAWNQVMTLKAILEDAGDVQQFVGRDKGEAVRAAILGYTGGVVLGGPEWECPGATFPSVCSFYGSMMTVDNQGVRSLIPGAEEIDLRPLYAELAAMGG